MTTIKIKKPSGAVVEMDDNEANREYAELRGWVVLEPKKKAAKKKRSTRKK